MLRNRMTAFGFSVAAAAGLACFCIAGEMADCGQGPGAYRSALFDAVAGQKREDIERCARVEIR